MADPTTDPYTFTQTWFDPNIPVWTQIAAELPTCTNVLEIGSYEGRSAVWVIENMLQPNGTLTAIDTWEGGEEHVDMGVNMGAVEQRFDHNINTALSTHRNRTIRKLKGTSFQHLRTLPEATYDFIYIDGSHIARDVLCDACLAWPLLRIGGLLTFDDYLWGNPRDAIHRPKIAIDNFVNIYAEQLAFFHIGNQLTIKKING